MENLKKIWAFINSKIFVYVVIIVLILLLAHQCQRTYDLKKDNVKKEQNISAADNVIKTYKNKDGQTTAEKAIWILSEKELKKQNKELYDMVNNQDGKIITLNNSIIRLSQDAAILHDSLHYFHTVILAAEKINKTEWNLPWVLEYKWDEKNYDRFKGHTLINVDTIKFNVKNLGTEMDSRESQIDLTFGEKVVDGKYNVYIASKYPGLTEESISGVLIDPNSNDALRKLIKKKHWFTGFSVTLGISPSYDLLKGAPTIVVGPTLGYSIYQW